MTGRTKRDAARIVFDVEEIDESTVAHREAAPEGSLTAAVVEHVTSSGCRAHAAQALTPSGATLRAVIVDRADIGVGLWSVWVISAGKEVRWSAFTPTGRALSEPREEMLSSAVNALTAKHPPRLFTPADVLAMPDANAASVVGLHAIRSAMLTAWWEAFTSRTTDIGADPAEPGESASTDTVAAARTLLSLILPPSAATRLRFTEDGQPVLDGP